jgi:hypothetical protein
MKRMSIAVLLLFIARPLAESGRTAFQRRRRRMQAVLAARFPFFRS